MASNVAGFVRSVIASALRLAPSELGPYRTSIRSWIGQLYTGHPDLHYEVWPRPRLGVVELGLHFEADPLTNARLLGAFRAREREIRGGLGRSALLEPWDKGWARVYETHPIDDLSARACAERLAAYVARLEPILREELPGDVPWRPVRGRVKAKAARR